jgi:hypothetical protein
VTRAETKRAWKQANPEKVKAQKARNRKLHPETGRGQRARYYLAHRDAINLRRRQGWAEQVRVKGPDEWPYIEAGLSVLSSSQLDGDYFVIVRNGVSSAEHLKRETLWPQKVV